MMFIRVKVKSLVNSIDICPHLRSVATLIVAKIKCHWFSAGKKFDFVYRKLLADLVYQQQGTSLTRQL